MLRAAARRLSGAAASISPRGGVEARCAALARDGRLLRVEAGADFGQLFPLMDAFVVHGGLGTTAEAMRCGKPVAVTGVLHQDQRLWGRMVERSRVGPPPCHIDTFQRRCVAFADAALDEGSEWARHAAAWPAARSTRPSGGPLLATDVREETVVEEMVAAVGRLRAEVAGLQTMIHLVDPLTLQGLQDLRVLQMMMVSPISWGEIQMVIQT